MDTRMYVMTHKKIDEIPEENYITLHVGKKGKEDLGYIGDDSGENISEKNPFYCELTGMYWIWKNVKCDIVGICHYRRFFRKGKKLMKTDYMEERLKKYSILVPNTLTTKEKNVYEHYGVRHYKKDLDLCRDVISEKYPEYVAAFDYVMQANLISVGNMWITHKSIFDKYCEWLFSILFEVENRIDMSGYDTYQKRVFGFLSERLFRVWLFMQSEPVGEEKIIQMELEGIRAEEEKAALFYRYAKLRVQPVLQLYQSGVRESLAQPIQCADDFEGKIPVWVCWWQGEQDMPEVVRCCIKSIQRNIPHEKAVFRFVTMENCLQYVTFSESVIRKFNEGKMTYAHLSEILRAELLYRYGGMWIDATYYVTKPIRPDIFELPLYTLRVEKDLEDTDVTDGRWSADLWYAQKGSLLFQFLMNSFLYYWEVDDKLIADSLMDSIIAIAVENLPDVQRMLEQCEFCRGNILELQNCIYKKYSPERMDNLLHQADFYKLSAQEEYPKENFAGERTIYGDLVERECVVF